MIEELDSQAQERQIQVQRSLSPLTTQGCTQHYFMLFSNLLANSITYSHPGGIVQEVTRKEGLRLSVTSEIGKGTTFEVIIPAEKTTYNDPVNNRIVHK